MSELRVGDLIAEISERGYVTLQERDCTPGEHVMLNPAEARALRDWLTKVLQPPHIESGACWCQPTLDFTNPETGVQHWIHHEPS